MYWQMKRLIRVTGMLFLVGLMVFAYSCTEKKTDMSEGVRAPKIDVRDARTGQALDIAQLKGKVVFVNFWATWCPPCREEMPSIEALHRDMQKSNDFVMVTILYRDNPKTASDYMQAFSYTFPMFTDTEGVSAGNFGVTGVPETYLIDKKGAMRKRVIGPADWNSTEAKAFIKSMLAE